MAVKKSKRKPDVVPKSAPKPELPDWLEDTPRGSEYHLMMDDHDGNWRQEVDLSRDEFEALKDHLGIMRGLLTPEEAEARA